MPQSNFGAGYMFAIPTAANPTPVLFGAVQDIAVDFQFDLKMLYGASQFPLEQARGKAKIDLKATIGRLDPSLFNQVFFNLGTGAGEYLSANNENGSIPATPFQITVANGATFSTDLGVYDVTAGKFLGRVASAPATGQYSVNTTTGVYTFAAADTGHSVRISYTYKSSSTGQTITATNSQMGSGPIFALQLINSFTGAGGKKSLSLYFPAVQSPKLTMPLKLDDFTLPQIEMSAQDDGSGNVFTWSLTG